MGEKITDGADRGILALRKVMHSITLVLELLNVFINDWDKKRLRLGTLRFMIR